jgi:hypothetical protein
MVRYRAASAFAPLPFDKHGVPGSIELVDDFITTAVLSDFVDAGTGAVLQSDLYWRGMEIASGAAVANSIVLEGESDHPGIIQLQTGGTTPADGDGCAIQLGTDVVAGQNTLLLDTNGVYIACVLRVLDVDGQQVEFGLGGQAPVEANASAVDIVSWVFDPVDTTNVSDEEWFTQVNGASSDTESISKLVSYVENDWVLLEIAADTTSATFRITTEDNTETIVLDGADSVTMPVVGLRPFISCTNVTTTEELLDVDLFVLRYMRRQPLTASWLGA